MTILAVQKWATNGHLIKDVAELGYLRKEWLTLDPTYGLGTFWTEWRPDRLACSDIDRRRTDLTVDFTKMPWAEETFDAVVFDPPYKLNGTATESVDARYGVGGRYVGIEGRHVLMVDGLTECIRVTRPGGNILVKCQDQVASGRKWWQTDLMTGVARRHGCHKVDRFDFLSHRAQPSGRRQVHAHVGYSTLLVFRKETL